MLNYGHPNDKPTKLWSTSYYVALFNRGKKNASMKKKGAPSTAVKYVDKSGRVRYKGTPALKASQFLAYLKRFCWGGFLIRGF